MFKLERLLFLELSTVSGTRNSFIERFATILLNDDSSNNINVIKTKNISLETISQFPSNSNFIKWFHRLAETIDVYRLLEMKEQIGLNEHEKQNIELLKRTVAIMAHGSSIAELEKHIGSLKKYNICWTSLGVFPMMEEFILGSEVMRAIMKLAHEVAKYDVSVLLVGESGTGKEMLAKIIHLQSPRAENPFVPVNCGVLSGLMFEDKLFGHEKGSFTGAIRTEMGCFEMADKGTLFLDEVSDLPLENQVDFLRVLEDFRFLRIGGNRLIEVDIRIISATNKDLKDLTKKGLFREDLFYRLTSSPYTSPL